MKPSHKGHKKELRIIEDNHDKNPGLNFPKMKPSHKGHEELRMMSWRRTMIMKIILIRLETSPR